MIKLLVVNCLLLLSFGMMTHSANASIQGVYKTDFNDMSLQLNGNHATGTYKYKSGQIDGILKGNRLTGTWIQTNAKGRLEFIFSDDFSAFTGKWGYDEAVPSKKWNGKKKFAPINLTPPINETPPAPPLVTTATAPLKIADPPKTENIKTTAGDDEYLNPGQSAMYKDLEVSLLSLTRTDDYINGPKKDHFYAVLKFKVKNMGKQEDSALIYTDLQWKNPATGFRTGYQRTTGVKLNNPDTYDLSPGAQGEFEEVYMFPDHLAEAEFHLLKSYKPKELARWMMTIQ